MAKDKPNLSMRIDSNIKEAFKQETYLAGEDMTEPIERFMVAYVNIKRSERQKK